MNAMSESGQKATLVKHKHGVKLKVDEYESRTKINVESKSVNNKTEEISPTFDVISSPEKTVE